VTTRRDAKQRPAPDLVNRSFCAEGPNQLWVADYAGATLLRLDPSGKITRFRAVR
jgi:hypothetical protein